MDPETRRRIEEMKATVAGATVHLNRPRVDRPPAPPPPLVPEEQADRPAEAPDRVAPWMEWEVERDRLEDRISDLEREVRRLREALAAIADQATGSIEEPPQ